MHFKKTLLVPFAIIFFVFLYSIGNIYATPTDYDNDGITNSIDLDSDNDGILNTDEGYYCNESTQTIVGSGSYTKDLHFFNWAGLNINANSTGTTVFTGQFIHNGITYKAEIQNVYRSGNDAITAVDMGGGYAPSYSIPMYNPAGNTEAIKTLFPTPGTVTYDIVFTAEKNGVSYPIKIAVFDAQVTNHNFKGFKESTSFTTNGTNFSLLEEIGGDSNSTGAILGENTKTITYLNSRPDDYSIPARNAMFYTEGKKLRITTEAKLITMGTHAASQAMTYAVVLNCDTDKDGIPNYLDIDSDNDGCADAIEGDGNILSGSLNASGSIMGTVNGSGLVLSGTTPITQGTGASQTAAKMDIINQPLDQNITLGQQAIFNIAASSTKTTSFSGSQPDWNSGSADVINYQWYENTGSGTAFQIITGETNPTLNLGIQNDSSKDGYQYKVELSCSANSCIKTSEIATLNIQNPSIELNKTADKTNLVLGDTITYTFTVKNTGNVTLSGITLTETNFNGNGTGVDVSAMTTSTLNPNETINFSGTYIVTQADINQGNITNQAQVTSKDPSNNDINDISDNGTPTQDTNGNGDNGDDPTTIITNASNPNTGGSGVGGGGGGGLKKDDCIEGDNSPSPYDGICDLKVDKINKPEIELKSAEEKQEEEKQEEIDLDELNEFLNYYKEKLKIIEKLREEQFKNGESALRGLPKLLPQTGTPILKRVKRLNINPRVDTSLPNKEVFRLAGSSNSDLSYWLQVLDKRDRNKDTYLVSPTNGLVVPINHMEKGTSDYENIISGRKIDENKYLKTGVAEYPGTSTNSYGEVGNKVIFGHSSYWKNDDGRYKTHFGKIIELDESEEVWIYKKTASGEYKRYRYFIEASYNTPASDVSVLKPGVGKNLTLITCTPIGGIAGRWIIKAKFIDEYLQELEHEVYFKSISFRNKEVIKKAIRKIAKSKNSKQVLYKLYNKVNYLLKKDKYKKVKNLLTYIKYSTALEIKKLK